MTAGDDLSQRFDRLVGTEFWRTRRNLTDVLLSRILTPLIVDTGTYQFDPAARLAQVSRRHELTGPSTWGIHGGAVVMVFGGVGT